jgi:hypothetical protein
MRNGLTWRRPSHHDHPDNEKNLRDFVVGGRYSAEYRDGVRRLPLSLRRRYLDACTCSSCAAAYAGDDLTFLRTSMASSTAGPRVFSTLASNIVASTTR